MMPHRWFRFPAVAILAAGAVFGQGTEPKPKAEDYAAHVKVGGMTIAAENMGHAVNAPQRSLVAGDFIVVEVAVYAEDNRPVAVHAAEFSLKVNGRKPLLTQSPGMVSSSIRYPNWEQRPTLVGTVGVGDGQVTVGAPPTVARFPGDPNARRQPIPRAPDPEDRSGVDKPSPMPVEEVIQRCALPEGDVHPPVSGYLFFAFKGKLKSIRTMELVYEGPAGAASLSLP